MPIGLLILNFLGNNLIWGRQRTKRTNDKKYTLLCRINLVQVMSLLVKYRIEGWRLLKIKANVK